MRRRLFAALATISVAFAAVPVAAQDIMAGGISQSWTSTQMLLNSEKRAWAAPECVDEESWSTACDAARPSRKPRSDRQAEAAARDAVPVMDDTALTFRPSLERRRRNFAQFIAKTRAVDPTGARELEGFLANDVIGILSSRIAPYGLRTDNVADAMALYVMEAWEVVNGKVLLPSRTRSLAVRRQMARAISSTSAFADASDAVKQEMAEAMLVQAGMISTASGLALQKNARDEIAALREAVKKGSRATLGFDLASMAMTDEGLRETKRTGAIDTSPAALSGKPELREASLSSVALLAVGAGTVAAALGFRRFAAQRRG